MKRAWVKHWTWYDYLGVVCVVCIPIGLRGSPAILEPVFLVLIVILSVLAILESTPRRREVRRQAIRIRCGQCVQCGYDLRGCEHERCPECGKEIRKGNPA